MSPHPGPGVEPPSGPGVDRGHGPAPPTEPTSPGRSTTGPFGNASAALSLGTGRSAEATRPPAVETGSEAGSRWPEVGAELSGDAGRVSEAGSRWPEVGAVEEGHHPWRLGRRTARLTLRTRLLLVLVGILAAGLVVSDLVTFTELRTYLVGQVDTQLQAVPVGSVADSVYRCYAQGTTICQTVPTDVAASLGRGTLAELLVPGARPLPLWLSPVAHPVPVLPSSLPSGSFTAHSSDGTAYRVLAQAVPSLSPGLPGRGFAFPSGTVLVVAVPLSGIDHDLAHLAAIEVLVSVVALAGLGVLSWWVVRRGLRPLREMTGTARAIAAGDLSRRVDHTEEGTEVGQLGQALNTMLGEIEQAFAARAASEERLRRFLADASHELRTPLTSIRGYAEMFDRGVRDRPEDLAVAMAHIRSEADRMGVLVEDLLLLARLDQQRPMAREPVDLAAIVQDAASAARVAHPDRSVSVDAPARAPVLGDPVRIRQVIDNLVTNALVYSPSDGPVDVAVRVDGAAAEITVADRGPGVAPEDRHRIFEPFQRLDRSRTRATGGVGLGLAIVAAIVRGHGGAVSVDPRPGGGSVFRVLLPGAALLPGPGPSQARGPERVSSTGVAPSTPAGGPERVPSTGAASSTPAGSLERVPSTGAAPPAPAGNGVGLDDPHGAIPTAPDAT